MASTCIDDSVLNKMQGLIERAIELGPGAELEIRLGLLYDRKFTPGVTRAHMDNIIQALTSNQTVKCLQSNNWAETEDYHFQHNRGDYRTRVSFNLERMRIESETIQKQKIDSFVIRSHNLDARVSLSFEQPIPDPPHAVNTSFVRIKQVKQYETASPFRIDCGIVWSGTQRSEAELKQSSEDGRFELEIELDLNCSDERKAKYPLDSKKGKRRLAKSMLLKVADLMLSPKVQMELVG